MISVDNYHGDDHTTLALQSLIDARHDVIRTRHSNQINSSSMPGLRTANRRGQGLEFIDLRQYNDADDVRHIDWNVTARSNVPYTRLFREECEQVTTVVVDLRPVMFTGSQRLRSVAAGQLAARVLWQAHDAGDRCAVMAVGHRTIRHSRPMSGNRSVLHSLDLIAGSFSDTRHMLQSTSSYPQTGHGPMLSEALQIANERARPTGRLIFISGFDTEGDENWSTSLTASAVANKLKAVLLIDPLELNSLPVGQYRYRQDLDTKIAAITTASRQHYNAELKRRLKWLKRQFTDNDIPLLSLATDTSMSDMLQQMHQHGCV